MSRFAFVLIAGVLVSASGAMAEPPPKAPEPTTVAPVTVSAAPQPKVIEEQTHAFVQSLAMAENPEVGQIARWYDPVCVDVVGLPEPSQAAAIKARIESVATQVGLPAASARCKPNVEVVFTPFPQQTMDLVARRHEYFLGYNHVHDRTRLKTVSHPIQAWYVTATRGEATGSVALAFSGFSGFSQQQTEVIDDPDNQAPNGCADSRLTTSCLQSLLHNVLIVADSKALEGKPLGLVADDMVMLALSQPRSLDGCKALPSVIDAFAKTPCPGRDPPDGLTQPDAAFLTALYQSDLRSKRKLEQSDLANRMARILLKAEGK